MRRVMRQRWPSCRSKGPSIPEHRWSLSLPRVQRALAEFERGVAHEALAVAGEACRKAEEENNRLKVERLALVMELGTIKDDFAAFREKAVVDRETMEVEFDASSDMLFNYGYGC